MRARHLPFRGSRLRDRATRKSAVVSATAAMIALIAGCGSDDAGETDRSAAAVTVENCDRQVSVTAPPERVYATYQPSAEMMSALGLGDRLVGSSFFDAEFLPEYADGLRGVPYSENNPTREALLATKPDFVFAGYGTVFAADTPDGVGTRASLEKLGIQSYVLTPFCPTEDGKTDQEVDPADVSIDAVYEDLLTIGRIFGVEDKARSLIDDYKDRITTVETAVKGAEKPTVAYVRPQEDGTFQVCTGVDFGTRIIEAAGGVNAFEDVTSTRNIYVDAEELIKRDPDVILTNSGFGVDYTLDDAMGNVNTIVDNPAFAGLTAVRNNAVHPSLFADRSAGVRTAHAVEQMASLIHPDLVD